MTGNTLVPGKASEAEISRMMEQYGPMLVGTCKMLLGDVHLAQDAVQETFVKAYRNLGSFRSTFEGSEKAWLTRIAVNVCRDYHRSKWFRFVDRKTQIESLVIPAPEAGTEAKELYRAVQGLPRKYRELILLHYYQGMSVKEITDTLGLASTTVYRRMDKARQMLKKTLEGWDFNG